MPVQEVFHSSQQVGEIVAAFAGASNLFKAHGIDFCCGGTQTLSEALRQRGIAEPAFLQELQAAYEESQRRGQPDETDWRTTSYTDLIKHIIKEHHGFLRKELPLLVGFVNKIVEVHGARHPELAQLRFQFMELRAELEPHIDVEENDLFPPILAYEKSGDPGDLARAMRALEKLEAEHQSVGRQLREIRQTTRGYKLPEDACQTYAITFQKLIAVESDTFTHIHLENNILFPRLVAAKKGTQPG